MTDVKPDTTLSDADRECAHDHCRDTCRFGARDGCCVLCLRRENAALTERLRVAEERIATVRGLHTHLNGCSGKSAEIVHGEIVIAPGECAHYECEQGCERAARPDGIRRHGDLCPTMRVLAPTNDAAPKEPDYGRS
jgi:hypothetical protein